MKLREIFCIVPFQFTLYDNIQGLDVCRYIVKQGNLQYRITFVGIDSVVECGTRSNVDFVHFVWRYTEEQYAFRKHAITIVPGPVNSNLRLLSEILQCRKCRVVLQIAMLDVS